MSAAGYSAVWEFDVQPGREAEFERIYGAGGPWEQLFRRAPGYLETHLAADLSVPRRYVTVDRWLSERQFSALRERFGPDYDALDRMCESLTTRERRVAVFGGEQLIDTERLRLRRFTLDDAEFVFELVNDPAFLRFIGDKGVRTLEDARGYLRTGPLESYARYGFGMYHVSLANRGTAIGMCGLVRREALKDVDVGFAFLPRFHSQGYGFEAASAVLAYARHVLGITRIAAIAKPDNAASIRVIGKLGLKLEGTARIGETDDHLFARDL